jgi:hypothetical protein
MKPSIINISFACDLSFWSMNYIVYPFLVKSTQQVIRRCLVLYILLSFAWAR